MKNKIIPFVNYSLQYQKIKSEIDEAIFRCLEKGDLILRDEVEKFENNLAEFTGAKYAVALNSGTDALFLSLIALGIQKNDEVITSSHTFWATIESIYHSGAKPIVIDIKLKDFLMDEDLIEGRITEKTKVIMPVYLAGTVPDMKKIEDIAIKYNLEIIADACQALGAKKITSERVMCYSFYPAKILGAYGDAGAIVTNDYLIAEKIKTLRNHGDKGKVCYGYNSRMDNLQAAILNVKFKYLDKYIKRRKEIALMYDKDLPKPNFLEIPPTRDIYQDYIIRVFNHEIRDDLYKYLKEKGIETMKNEYPFPEQYLKFANSDLIEKTTLRLPIYPELTDEEITYVIKQIKFFEK